MKAKKLLLLTTLIAFGLTNLTSITQASSKQENKNKVLVENFWNQVFNKHNTDVIETTVSDNYVQHSPSFPDGKEAFLKGAQGFLNEFPLSQAKIDHIGADGDYVYIHNHIQLTPDDRGQAAVDIFQVKNGKILAHWDVIQDVPEKAENNNTMFFSSK